MVFVFARSSEIPYRMKQRSKYKGMSKLGQKARTVATKKVLPIENTSCMLYSYRVLLRYKNHLIFVRLSQKNRPASKDETGQKTFKNHWITICLRGSYSVCQLK
jgi:hypothetical protein